MSQRKKGFNGGIQLGGTATSLNSKMLEKVVRDYIKELDNTHHVASFNESKLQEIFGTDLRLAGFNPDGGIFVDSEGNPVVAIECKHQGKDGNAIERWAKNYMILDQLGVKRYLTFCTGVGFFDGNSAERIVRSMSYSSAYEQGVKQDADIWNTGKGKAQFYRYSSLTEAQVEIPQVIDAAIRDYDL